MAVAQTWDDINKQLADTQKMLDPLATQANAKADLIDKYVKGNLVPQSGAAPQMITIRNSQTGETKQVPADQLQQYGITQTGPSVGQSSNPFYQAQLQQAQATQLDPIVKEQQVEAGKLSAEKQNAPIDLVNDLQTGMTLDQAMKKYSKFMSADDILTKYQQSNKYGPVREDGKTLKEKYGVSDSALGKGFGSISDKENTRIALEKLQKARDAWDKASKIPLVGPNTPGGIAYNSEIKTLAEVLTRTLSGRGAVQQGIDRTISTLPGIGDPKYMISGNADAAFNAVQDQILGGYTTKDLNLPASKHDQVMKPKDNTVKNVANFLTGGAVNVMQDIGAGLGTKMVEGNLQGREQQAKQLEDQASKTTDPQQKKRLLQQANVLRQQISDTAQKETQGFSSDVNKNPITRAISAGIGLGTSLEFPGVGSSITKGGGKVGGGVVGAMGKMVPKDLNIAANTFKSLFTIPTKRAADLMPLETSKKMVEYGITGSMNSMKQTAQRVTGNDGLLTNVVNDAVKNLDNVTLPVGTIRDSVMKMIDDSLELTNSDKEQIKTQIGQLEKLKTSGELLDKMREFQNLGHQYLNKSTYLTNDIRKINIGKAYLNVAQNMSDAIDKAAGEKDVISQLKTPQMIQRLSEVSPKLAQDFSKAKTLKDIRSLEAPFVRLSKMIDLNEQQTTSAAANLGKRVLGAAGGFAIGNVPGAVVGALGEPIVEDVINSARAPILTRLAKVIGKMGSN